MLKNERMHLPDYAEATFELACAAVGATAHPPRRDRNGWDYLVEFAQTDDPRPADLHEPILKVWAQVKSSEGDGLRCKVKLSNLLKSAQSHEPWFIVSIAKETSGRVKIYAKHVWKDLIERTLREARKGSVKGRRPNKINLTLKFLDEDARTETDLLSWMRACVTAYCLVERKLHRSNTLESGQIQLDFGHPRIIDSWIVRDADDKQRSAMQQGYEKAVKKLNDADIRAIELGDIRNFWFTQLQ